MSRKHKTLKAGSALGINQYGWGNDKNRKRPKGVGAPMGQVTTKINYTRIISGEMERVK